MDVSGKSIKKGNKGCSCNRPFGKEEASICADAASVDAMKSNQ
jgi:hypothetical protein